MYVVMNGLVVPLSAATPKPAFSAAMVVIGLRGRASGDSPV